MTFTYVDYNLTNYSTSLNIATLAQTSNSLTQGWFFILFIIVLGIIMIGYFKLTSGTGSATRMALLILAIISFMLKTMSVISDFIMFSVWILLAILIAVSYGFGE